MLLCGFQCPLMYSISKTSQKDYTKPTLSFQQSSWETKIGPQTETSQIKFFSQLQKTLSRETIFSHKIGPRTEVSPRKFFLNYRKLYQERPFSTTKLVLEQKFRQESFFSQQQKLHKEKPFQPQNWSLNTKLHTKRTRGARPGSQQPLEY